MAKKILVITPKFPLPATGACEQERLAGMEQLKRLGYDVRVIAKVFDWQDKEQIYQWSRNQDIKVDLLEYEFGRDKNWQKRLKQLGIPLLWDGAAYEYASPNTQQFVEQVVKNWQPDVVWFDYTYLWPLYKLVQRKNIPIITRSINFEPVHFLQEDGVSLKNILKFLPKIISEIITTRKSDFMFSITPKEEKIYRILGVQGIATLSLRSLPKLLKESRIVKDKQTLHLFFMGASYNVHHSRKAVELIIKDVAPALQKKFPNKFIFHILGKKLPEDFKKYCRENVKEEGYVPNLEKFLSQMDIAVIPSIMGAGMQQKIFEPLVYGIPTITSPRGLAGYPFKDGEHLLLAKTKDEYVDGIVKLQDVALRKRLSEDSLKLSRQIFSRDVMDMIVKQGIEQVTK